jgi:DNA-directed RNA polymerase specialized sigma24 family protein
MGMQTTRNEIDWGEGYPQLHRHTRRFVARMKIANWQGQEEDVTWDIVQESMRKVFEYVRKVERDEEEPIQSLAGLLRTTAQNSTLDLRRREKRLFRETPSNERSFADTETSFSELATENVYHERLFRILAHEIAHFPRKQRQALLADLAERMAFDRQPTTLQAAFQAEGIHLEEYRRTRPLCGLERNRNAALLYQAYQRLKNLEEVKKYLTEA